MLLKSKGFYGLNMQKKLSPVQNPSIAPITYWFNGGQLRIEIVKHEESNCYVLYLIHSEPNNEQLVAKEQINAIRIDTVQYASEAHSISFLATSKQILSYDINTKTFNELNFTDNILSFVMDKKGQNFAALDCLQRLIVVNRNQHTNLTIYGVISMTQQDALLYFVTTKGRLCQMDLRRPDKHEKTKVSFKSHLTNERMIISIHPLLPIIAFTNNTFDLKGEGRRIVLFHRYSGKILGVISKITSPIIEIKWLPNTNRLLCISRFDSRHIDAINAVQNQKPFYDLIDIISLDNFHDHFVLECDHITTQVISHAQERLVLTSQFCRAQGWEIPTRQSPVDKLTFQILLTNGQSLKLNGIALLKILHRSVQDILAPIVRQQKHTPHPELRKITQGVDWLKTAGRLATFVSGEVMKAPQCGFVNQDANKLYGTFTIGIPGHHQTQVTTSTEKVTIKHAKSNTYVHIADYINRFLDEKAVKISTEVIYQSMCSILDPEVAPPQIPTDLEHANLAKILLARLQGQNYPDNLSLQFKEFLDSLMVLMFGMETSRINATYLSGVMVLDLIQNHCTFGRFNRVYSWQNIFTSGPGYHWNDFEQNDFGGKYPLASLSTGPKNFIHRTKILCCTEADELRYLNKVITDYQHHRIVKKEIRLLLHWLYNLSKEHVDLLTNSPNIEALKQRLAQLFQNRLREAYALQPPSTIPLMRPNDNPEIRQYELRTQSQKLTGIPHYYLEVTNITTKTKKTDLYYHRTDTPCKMIPADYIARKNKVINLFGQLQQTRAEIFLTGRNIFGIKKIFKKSLLSDGVIATQREVMHFSGRNLRVRSPLEETLTSVMERLITGRSRPNIPPEAKRQRVEAPPVQHRPSLMAPLCMLVGRYIETVSMPYFDFFAYIPEDRRDELTVQQKLSYWSSIFDPKWLKVVRDPELLYQILQNIRFTNVKNNDETYTSEITINSILRIINQAINLPNEEAFKLAVGIFQNIERQLFSQAATITSFYMPDVLITEMSFDPDDAAPPTMTSRPKPEFIQKVIELANLVSPHNLANREAITLAMKIIHGITGFRFERQMGAKSKNNDDLAPCPRCFSETAPPYPALPYDYDQTVCLVAEEHPYYHRIMPNDKGNGCELVDTHLYRILDTRQNPVQPYQTTKTFVKHAVEILDKRPCQECWLPLPRANAEVRENRHRDNEGHQHQSAVSFFRSHAESRLPEHVHRQVQNNSTTPTTQSAEPPPKRRRENSPVLTVKTANSQIPQRLFSQASQQTIETSNSITPNVNHTDLQNTFSLLDWLSWSLHREMQLRALDSKIFSFNESKTLRDQLMRVLSIIEVLTANHMQIPQTKTLLEHCDSFLLQINMSVENPHHYYSEKLRLSDTLFSDQPAVKMISDINSENNDALIFFVASECGKNQRDFDRWYHQSLMSVLIGADDAIKSTISNTRYINYFAHSSNLNGTAIPYELHLLQLTAYANRQKKLALMVSVEPGAGQNHFIMTVVIAKLVFVINPMGKTAHHDLYIALLALQEKGVIQSVFLYEPRYPMQHDPNNSVVSCGPICVELMRILNARENLSEDLQKLEMLNSEHSRSKLKYMAFDLQPLLLGTSLEKLGESSQNDYVAKIVSLRQSHCKLLQGLNQVQVDYLKEQTNLKELIDQVSDEITPDNNREMDQDEIFEEDEESDDKAPLGLNCP